jgi:replicative DNA helicase
LKEADLTLQKLPPQNIEAEQAVLGAVIFDNEALPAILELRIEPEDFYKEAHRRVYRAILDLYDKNEPVDIVTLADHLRRTGDIDAIGGLPYLSLLADSVPTSANIRHHARIVSEKALLRSLIRTATNITSKVYEEGGEADDLVDYAESAIFDISDQRTKTSFAPMKAVIKDTFKMIEQLYDKKEAITGVSTGFKDLDEMTSGFQPGDLIIIGGRPGMGKTAFALNIAQHTAINLRMPVAVFSLEMSKEQLAMRMLCAESMVNSGNVRKGFIGKEDWPRLTNAAGRLADAPIFIDDSSGISVLEIRAKARRLKKEHGGLSMVVVDYLQLMRSRGKFERREQEISDISRSLKGLAKELKVPVVALSQLNRSVESRQEKIPSLADLRESGAIEQDADVIIFLYRAEIYSKTAQKGLAEIHVAKQRSGPTGMIKLSFRAECTRFNDFSGRMDEEEDEGEVY